MFLENARDVVRGILILVFAAIAQWGDLTIGLILLAFMGLMVLQSAWTDWCPADLFLRPMGVKRKREGKR
jgi:Inner membrane protein YgaP-like, transmembrane domain